MSGILTDSAIMAAVETGDILIEPFRLDQVNPSSYDLTLGPEVRVYEEWVDLEGGEQHAYPRSRILDIRQEPKTVAFQIPEDGIVLRPGIGYLMHTAERVRSFRYNPVLDGKSSIARLFLQVHAAGYGDLGFDGQYTLEVTAVHPLRIYSGMRIAQMRFHTLEGEVRRSYQETGHYTGEAARGAVASQAWKQFHRTPS
jgi:dCTP deaminase